MRFLLASTIEIIIASFPKYTIVLCNASYVCSYCLLFDDACLMTRTGMRNVLDTSVCHIVT